MPETAPSPVRLLARLAHPVVIAAGAVLSLVLGGGAGLFWVTTLRDYWRDQRICPPGFNLGSPFRVQLSALAVAAAVVAIVALARFSAGKMTSKSVSVYWIASLVLWLTSATMVALIESSNCFVEFSGGGF